MQDFANRVMGRRAWVLVGCMLAIGGLTAARAGETPRTWHVAADGNDTWSGQLPRPNAAKSDGPFATLTRARDAIRQQNAAGKLTAAATVVVHGTVRLSETFVLEPQDSGTAEAPVRYVAADGAPAALSGGRSIGGWKKGTGDLWQTEVPEVRDGKWYFRELFVNGQRRIRARTPNEGFLRTGGPAQEYKRDKDRAKGNREARTEFKFKPGDVSSGWQNPDDVNIFLYHSWTNSLHWIEKIDAEAQTVRLSNATGWPLSWWDREQRYYVENVREGLDSPGEWYLNRKTGRLEYWPLPGEDLSRVAVVAPVVSQLIRLDGNWEEGQLVHHVEFRGLAIEHADWPFDDRQKTYDGQSVAFAPGAVQARGAEHVTFENCAIAHVGCYGVWLESGCKHNRLVRCEVHDLGAGGVRIGETIPLPKPGANPAKGTPAPAITIEGNGPRDTGHNVVDNCFVHDGGHVFAAGTGMFLGHTAFNQITHNEICDFKYSGVCVGWIWGFAPSPAHHNRIADNHIHHLGWGVLSDMGGVYSLGPSPGTVVAHNLVHHVNSYSYGGWGLYTDEGSSQIVLENNIAYDTKTGGFHQHYGADNEIRNNIFAFSREVQIQRSREDLKNSVVFERNIVYCDNDQVLMRVWRNGDYRVDYNDYWSTAQAEPIFDNRSFAEWQQTSGQDQHSVLADPKFVAAAQRDFRLQPDSPALKLGFKPISVEGIGLYGERAWTQKPLAVQRPEFILPPTAKPAPTTIDDGFETTAVGQLPQGPKVSGEQGPASVRVSRDRAAAGQQSLKVVDAEGLPQAFCPWFYYTFNHRQGKIRASYDIWLGSGALVNNEWRDAAKPYHSGPSLTFDTAGGLSCGKQKLMPLPTEQWIHVEATCSLGPDAPGTWDLTVTIPGQPPRQFPNLAVIRKEFNRLQWFGFSSNATKAATYYLDNVKLAPVPPAKP